MIRMLPGWKWTNLLCRYTNSLLRWYTNSLRWNKNVPHNPIIVGKSKGPWFDSRRYRWCSIWIYRSFVWPLVNLQSFGWDIKPRCHILLLSTLKNWMARKTVSVYHTNEVGVSALVTQKANCPPSSIIKCLNKLTIRVSVKTQAYSYTIWNNYSRLWLRVLVYIYFVELSLYIGPNGNMWFLFNKQINI